VLTLVLTRHGLTPRSKPEQHLGQKIDIGLSDEGRAQAEALARRLTGIELWKIVSSPLVRARQTAEIVAGGRTIDIDARLAEMDYGRWEGMTYEQIEELDAEGRRRWEEDPATRACPSGESGNDVARRVRAFLEELLEDHVVRHGSSDATEWPVLAVAHSSTNRILMCVALDLPVREFRQRFSQGQVNLTVLRFEHGDGPTDARLVLANDLAHVRPAGATPWE
jgi:broad specificity phosphatase PhoE